MKFLRYQVFALFFCASSFFSFAQVKFPVTNNELRTSVQKVVTGFFHNMEGIKGDTLEVRPQSVEFTSQLDFPLASSNSVTQYISKKPIYSWQAEILSTEDFDEAVKKYKWIYNQLKVMTLTLDNGNSFTLSGTYDKPEETRKFSSSIFQLTPSATNIPKLKIEASMQFIFPAEWKVGISIFEKQREDMEKGDTIGD